MFVSGAGGSAWGAADGNSVSIAATTSLADMQAVLGAIGDLHMPSVEECANPNLPAALCWSKYSVGRPSVFLAMAIGFGCPPAHIKGHLSGATLQFDVEYRGKCQAPRPGQATGTRPGISVASVPRDQLPSSILTVVLTQLGSSAHTTIDLRPAADPLPDPQQRFQVLKGAIRQATEDMQRRLLAPTGLLEVGMRHWPDASLGCPKPGASYAQRETAGYILVFASASGANVEYHASPDGIVACGP